MFLPWILCGVLLVTVIVLFIKVWLLKRSMNEICVEFTEHLVDETNTLISISSRNRQVRHFTMVLNNQLRLLRKQRRKYLSGEQELGEAVTNISHDLRTPLTAICGYLDLLEQEEKSESVQRYIEVIKNRTEALVQLTEELFSYSVIITMGDDNKAEPVIINDVLEECVAAFYATLTERGIAPNIWMPENKVVRNLDRSALARVFSNLLSNAVRYSDSDLDIALSETGEIVFTNTASALNEVQVGKLFDRFYTIEAAQKSTGLGLAIARTLTEKINGTISANYENGKLSIYILLSDIQS